MSEKELEIFELCEKLTELLGDKEAIADLKELHSRHTEMFKNMKEVADLIQEIVTENEVIVKNKTPQSEKDFIVAKKLHKAKMGEVGVRKDGNISKIFHANKRDERQLKRLLKSAREEGRLLVEASSVKTAPTRLDHYADKSNDLPKCENTPSTTTNDIIAQNNNKSSQNTPKNNQEPQMKAMQEAAKKASLKLGLGDNDKNSKGIELNKSQDINFSKGER